MAFNPLVVIALMAAVGVLALRIVVGRQIVLDLSARGWAAAAALLVAALAMNWWYVAQYHAAAG